MGHLHRRVVPLNIPGRVENGECLSCIERKFSNEEKGLGRVTCRQEGDVGRDQDRRQERCRPHREVGERLNGNTRQVKETLKEQQDLRQQHLPINAYGRSSTSSDRGRESGDHIGSLSEGRQCNEGDEVPRVEVHPSIFVMIRDSDPSVNDVSLLKKMQIVPNSLELQVAGCKRIAEWAADSHSAPSQEILETLFRLSNRYSSSSEVQHHVLSALGGFCSSTYGSVVRGKIILLGGSKLVRNAMNNHPDNALVLEAGCVALDKLFEEKDRSIDALGRHEVDAVTLAMKVRRKDTWEMRNVLHSFLSR